MHYGWRTFRLGLSLIHSALPLIEHDGFTAIDQHPMFNMQSDRSGQDVHLKITAFANEILHGIPMADTDHVLLDNGTFVQFRCSVMRRRPDDFDSTIIGLMIGLGSDEMPGERNDGCS